MIMKKMINQFVVFLIFVASPFAANAGSAVGMLSWIIISNNMAYFSLSGAPTGRPTCAANTMYWMIKDETSSLGKQQVALLLTAKAAGKVVSVTGTGTCTKWPDGEDAAFIGIQ